MFFLIYAKVLPTPSRFKEAIAAWYGAALKGLKELLPKVFSPFL